MSLFIQVSFPHPPIYIHTDKNWVVDQRKVDSYSLSFSVELQLLLTFGFKARYDYIR